MCVCRHVVRVGGRRVSAQASGRSECGPRSESAEFRVLDQSLDPGIIHFILGLVHPVTRRRQQEPHPEYTGRCARTHSHRYANTVNILYRDVKYVNVKVVTVCLAFKRTGSWVRGGWKRWQEIRCGFELGLSIFTGQSLLREKALTDCIKVAYYEEQDVFNKCKLAKGNSQAPFCFTSLSPSWCFISNTNVFWGTVFLDDGSYAL